MDEEMWKEVTVTGGAEIAAFGFAWGLSANPTTAYGANRSFTAAAPDPLAAPLNLCYLAYDSAVELFWAPPPSVSPILYYEVMRGNDLVGGYDSSVTAIRYFSEAARISAPSNCSFALT